MVNGDILRITARDQSGYSAKLFEKLFEASKKVLDK